MLGWSRARAGTQQGAGAIPTAYYLVRHAQTAWLPGGLQNRYQTRSDIPLSDSGREQARRLAERLAAVPFQAAFTSDLSRSAETAGLVLHGRGVPLSLDPDLREIDVGAWEGLSGEEVLEQYPKLWVQRNRQPLRFAPPGGERIVDAAARLRQFIAKTSALPQESILLVVSHQNALRVLIALLLRLPLTYHRRFLLDPASVTIVQVDGGSSSVVLLNDTCHLDTVA